MSARIARTLALSVALTGAALSFTGCAQPSAGSGTIKADKINAGIIGGTLATGDEAFAKNIAIVYDTSMKALCTGSIISDELILTAAHCVVNGSANLVVGFGTDLDSPDVIPRRAIVAIMDSKYPQRYKELLDQGDLALVGFVGGLPAGYEPVRMLDDVTKLTDGETVLLAGYGISNGVTGEGGGKLRSVETTIKSASYSPTEISLEQSLGKGACHGDSGGPAYVTLNGERLLVGITSRGVDDTKNDCSVLSAYTSVPANSEWIKTTSTKLTTAINDAIARAKQAAKDKAAGGGADSPTKPGSTPAPQEPEQTFALAI